VLAHRSECHDKSLHVISCALLSANSKSPRTESALMTQVGQQPADHGLCFDSQGEWPELQHHFWFGKARYDCNVRAVGRGAIID
jgi:hypothetical protein